MSFPSQAETPPTILQMAFGGGTPLRALSTAAIVGTLLTAINQGDVIASGSFPPVIKVILTYCVPYCVTTWGAILGKRAQWLEDRTGAG